MNNLIIHLAEVANINPVSGGDTLVDNVTSILNDIIFVLGLVCVVVILIGGINYLTSAGDSGKVEKGKKTILYGLIGLAISALSFAIVNFVILNIIGGGNGGGSQSQQQDTSNQTQEIKQDGSITETTY